MDDELYPDSEPEESPDAPEEKSESKEKDKKDDHKDEPTELVSKKFLGLDEDTKAEPGHKCTLEVVHDFGDEVEVRYVKHKKKPHHDEEMSADDELDSIDAKG